MLPRDFREKRGRVVQTAPLREMLDLVIVHRKHGDRSHRPLDSVSPLHWESSCDCPPSSFLSASMNTSSDGRAEDSRRISGTGNRCCTVFRSEPDRQSLGRHEMMMRARSRRPSIAFESRFSARSSFPLCELKLVHRVEEEPRRLPAIRTPLIEPFLLGGRQDVGD